MDESVKIGLQFNFSSKSNIDKVADAIQSHLNSALKDVEGTADKVDEKIEKVANSAKKVDDTSTIQSLQKQLEAAKSQLENLDKAFEQLSEEQQKLAVKAQTTGLTDAETKRFEELDQLIIKNGEDTDIVNKKINELTNALDKMKSEGLSQGGLSTMANELVQKFTEIREKASNIYLDAINHSGEFEGKLDRLNSRLVTQSANAQKLSQSLIDIASQEVVPSSIVKLQKELEKSEKELQKLDEEFEKLATEQNALAQKRITVNGLSSLSPEEEHRFQELDELIIKNGQDTDVLTSKIDGLKAHLQEVQLNPELTPEFQNLSTKLYTVTSGIQSTSSQMGDLQASEGSVASETELLKQGLGGVDVALLGIAQTTAKVTDALLHFDIGQFLGNFSAAASEIWQTIERVAQTVKSVLQPILITVFNTVKKISAGIKSAFSGIAEKISSVASSLNPFNKHLKLSNNLISQFTKRLYKMVINTYIFFQLRKAIRALFAQFKEGFTEYFKFDKQMGATVDTMKAKITQFNNALAGALIPLLEALLPHIIRIIDALTVATDKLAQFIAALSGKSSYVKAKVIQNIGDSLEDVKEKADAAKRSLASFDELEVQNNTSNNVADTEALKDYFEIVPISSDILDMVNKISEALDPLLDKIRNKIAQMLAELKDAMAQVKVNFQQGDFEHLLTPLTDLLAKWLNEIDWNKIRQAANKIGSTLARILKSLFNNQNLAQALGRTLAGIINTAVEFAHGFLSTASDNKLFEDIGIWLATMLNSAINDIDWVLLGTTLGEGINVIVDFAIGFLETIDTSRLGKSLGDMLNAGVNTIDWTRLGYSIALAVNRFVDLWYAFITTADTYRLGLGIGTALQTALTNINWAKVGQSFAQSFNKASDVILGFFDGYEQGTFGHSLAEALNGFFTDFDAKKLGTSINTFFTSIFKEIETWAEETNWEDIGYAIADFIVGIDIPTMIENVSSACYELVKGIVTALVAAIAKLSSEYSDDESSPIANALASLFFPVNLLLRVIKPLIKDFVEALFNSFGYEMNQEDWDSIWTDIVNDWPQDIQSVLDSIEKAWNEFWYTWSLGVQSIGYTFGTFLDTWLLGANTIKDGVVKVFQSIWNFAIKIFEGLANFIIDEINGVLNNFNVLISAVNKLGLNLDKIPTLKRLDLSSKASTPVAGPSATTPSMANSIADMISTGMSGRGTRFDTVTNGTDNSNQEVNVNVMLQGDADDMLKVVTASAVRQSKRSGNLSTANGILAQ